MVIISGCNTITVPSVPGSSANSSPVFPAAGPEVESPDATIVIKYTPSFTLLESNNILVINISIDNKGYSSFDTSPINFHVVINDKEYPADVELSVLKTFQIPDGGKIRGKLAFKVPSDTESFSFIYTGIQSYNIIWHEVAR
jgi:hypothetical protein